MKKLIPAAFGAYGLGSDPFSTYSTRGAEIYLSDEMRETVSLLTITLAQGGLAALIGALGTGKSSVVRYVIARGGFRIVRVHDPEQGEISVRHVQQAVAWQLFGVNLMRRGQWNNIVHDLLSGESGPRIVVICDDSQDYHYSTLATIRRMSEMVALKTKGKELHQEEAVMSVLYVGRPALAEIVMDYNGRYREVALRCAPFFLKGYQTASVRAYVNHVFKQNAVARESPPTVESVFAPDAISLLCARLRPTPVHSAVREFFHERDFVEADRRANKNARYVLRFGALDINMMVGEAMLNAWHANPKSPRVKEAHIPEGAPAPILPDIEPIRTEAVKSGAAA